MKDDRSLDRIMRIGVILSFGGAIAFWIARDARNAIGFLTGATLSLVSLHTLRRVVEGFQPGAIKSVRGSAMLYILRYLIIGAAVYVIVKLLEISVMPVVAGLFVTAAAVMAEILFELVSTK